MTANEMYKLVGRTATWYPPESTMAFTVTIRDVKAGGWGRTLCEIEPVAGRGSQWVQLGETLELEDK
jgi:hypothetical protein